MGSLYIGFPVHTKWIKDQYVYISNLMFDKVHIFDYFDYVIKVRWWWIQMGMILATITSVIKHSNLLPPKGPRRNAPEIRVHLHLL